MSDRTNPQDQPKSEHRRSTERWRMPIILALLIIFGLLAALSGSGIWQALSWIALATPLIVLFRKIFL